jgi:hypothetical protein
MTDLAQNPTHEALNTEKLVTAIMLAVLGISTLIWSVVLPVLGVMYLMGTLS